MTAKFNTCLFTLITAIFSFLNISAQDVDHQTRHLYKPQHERIDDEGVNIGTNTYHQEMEIVVKPDIDSVAFDSLRLVWQRRQDSVAARIKFIEDSVIAHEAFIRDSIAERKRIIDSLYTLKQKLEPLLEASVKNFSNEIIFRTSNLTLVGDSVLSDFESDVITFDFTSAYTPWKSVVNLSDKPPKITYATVGNKITGISCPQFTCNYKSASRGNILIINSKSSILNRASGKVYKEPVDSVFFNRGGKVAKIKKYIQYYSVIGSFKKGQKLYLELTHVKQFEYNNAGEMTRYEVTKFCDRRKPSDAAKVCNVTSFTINKAGSTYTILRNNSPANEFSDGTFIYTYKQGNLSSVTFKNVKGNEKRKTIIEVNEQGNVSRYLYDKDGVINQTLLVNYYPTRNGNYRVETITCLFENDGISYYQKNNTTGKSRTRDKLTMEWSDWK